MTHALMDKTYDTAMEILTAEAGLARVLMDIWMEEGTYWCALAQPQRWQTPGIAPTLPVDPTALPFASESFPAAFTVPVRGNHLIGWHEAVCAEIRRVLRPGGLVLMAIAPHQGGWLVGTMLGDTLGIEDSLYFPRADGSQGDLLFSLRKRGAAQEAAS